MSRGVRNCTGRRHTFTNGGRVGSAPSSDPFCSPPQYGRDAPALKGAIVYDPFGGSGTTLVEAVKLGARVVARDINPVATLTQRQALQAWDFDIVEQLFAAVEASCRANIDALYVTAYGEPVLHYFWVAMADCPDCDESVELFSSYVFAKHAYPRRHPAAQATCPYCHAVCPVDATGDTQGLLHPLR